MLQHILDSLLMVLQWESVAAMVLGTVIGMVMGALPGVSGTLAVALAIPFTYELSPLTALGLLAGIHNGTSQGGAIPAILLRIPGTPGAICTTWDGYPLAQQGHGGAAIQLSAVSSAVGGMIGALALVLLAPPLANVALAFGPAEIFWVNVFGLTAIAAMLGDDILKGIIAACFGLLLGTIGLDETTGTERFTFDVIELINGLPMLVVMVGLFSFPPSWEMAQKTAGGALETFKLTMTKGVWKVRQVWRAWMKSSVVGIIIGILPGSSISGFIAYAEVKRTAREPEKFGKGSVEGLACAECVNNADNAASMIPALTLGVPGGTIAALMLGALIIQGFQPGPLLFKNSPEIVYGYAWQMFITSAMLIVLGGVVASRVFAHLLRLPGVLLLPLIVVMTVAGSFAAQNSLWDVYLAFGFGLVGLGMDRLGLPIAPVIIGLVLGAKAEFSLRVALLLTQGDPLPLFTRPICLVLIALTALMLLYPLIRRAFALLRARAAA